MFDIGPGELVLVAIIGLLVLGPQRLPKVAAEIGKWVGRARRTASQLRRQLEREIEISELEKPIAPPPPPPPRAAPSGGEVPPGPGTHVDQPETTETAPRAAETAPQAARAPEPRVEQTPPNG
jgi:sec-independent protein translocase protein TatB